MLGRSSARPKLVEPTGFDSPERAELALAIAAKAAADQAHADMMTAQRTLWSARTAAVDAIEEATAALEAAKAAAATHMIASAAGNASTAPLTIREARNALQDAEDRLAAVRAALQGMDDRIREAEGHQAEAAKRVQKAAAAVMQTSPEIEALLSEMAQLQDQILRRGSLLLWLIQQGVLLPKDKYGNTIEHPAARLAQQRMYSPPSYWTGNPRADLAALSPDAPGWQAALTALQSDATAPLPSGGR